MKRILFLLAVLACAVPSFAQQQVTITPVAQPSLTGYEIHESRFRRSPEWDLAIWFRPLGNTTLPEFFCVWGGMTRVVSTPNPPINGVPQPDTVTTTPNVGVQCSNGYSNVNAPTINFANGQAIVKGIKKAPLNTKSFDQRVCEQAVADGVFTGSCTGTVE